MIRNFSSLVRYFIFWYLIFVAARIVFIILNWKQANANDFVALASSFYHGLQLDVSMCCYLTAIPVLLWCISHFVIRKSLVNKILKTYNTVILAVIIFITIADGELYQHWGQKLNAYASSFAKFPKEMLIFSSGESMTKFVFIVLAFVGFAYFLYSKGMKGLDETNSDVQVWKPISSTVVILGLLFLGIRGGVGKSPLNQSSAFYSTTIFLNHTAINTTWNLLSSLVETNDVTENNPYNFLEETEARKVLSSLWFKNGGEISILNQPQPNIVIIILEGWTADVIGTLGGEEDVTPYFNQLCEKGLLFDQFYANGNRTDKGLAAIISSQPALAHSSIINNIQKFTTLPSLPKALEQKKYSSSFYYGGASEFANMKGYWLNSGYARIIDLEQFSLEKRNAEWGVHDDVLWEKVFEGLDQSPSPFFASVLTLSSHEPFNVPYQSKFNGTDNADKYRNAVAFADKALGDFFTKASKKTWFNNTLFIVLSDHGHQWPKDRLAHDPERFHIPLLFLGGALKMQYRGVTKHTIANQVDIAATLLEQLNLSTKSFNWSRNFLDTSYTPFASYTYNDGIGVISKKAKLVYDQESKQRILSEGDSSEFDSIEKLARSYEQLYYEEFRKR